MTLDDEPESQPFDELLTISDKSALIPQEEPAVQSWEELRTVSSSRTLLLCTSLEPLPCVTFFLIIVHYRN